MLQNLNLLNEFKHGFTHCGKCLLCNFARTCTSINISYNIKYKIIGNFNCYTDYVVYLIVCNKCDAKYVGQTYRPLYVRIKEHLTNINNNSLKSHLVHHFNDKCNIGNLEFLALQRIKNKDRRLLKERQWIKKFNSLHPFGLNQSNGSNSKQIYLVLPYNAISQRIHSFIQAKCENIGIDVKKSFSRHQNIGELLKPIM